MITRLFSIFDPFNNSLISNWIIILLPIFTIKFYYKFYNNYSVLFVILVKILNKEIKTILGKEYYKFFIYIFLFLFILIQNLLGLFSFTFPSTRHICFSVSLRIPLWTRLIIIYFSNFNHLICHLVPYGCPSILIPFIVLIETIRIVIRPLTLSIRLSANIIAGHIIIILICLSAYRRTLIFRIRIFTEIVISILESGVAFIQPYVFFILLTLYTLETLN